MENARTIKFRKLMNERMDALGIKKYGVLIAGAPKGLDRVPATFYRMMAKNSAVRPRLYKAAEYADVVGIDLQVVATVRETGEQFIVTDIR